MGCVAFFFLPPTLDKPESIMGNKHTVGDGDVHVAVPGRFVDGVLRCGEKKNNNSESVDYSSFALRRALDTLQRQTMDCVGGRPKCGRSGQRKKVWI